MVIPRRLVSASAPRELLVVLIAGLASCKRPQHDAVPAPPAVSVVSPPAIPSRSLTGFPWIVELTEKAADGGDVRIGFMTVPLGATEPRPLMVALHGASDRPEWACGAWRGITDSYAVLVCPRGRGPDHALGWQSPEDTRARIGRAIAAAREVLQDWVREDDSVVLAGFSMGAVQAAAIAAREPKRYRRVALAESSYKPDSSMSFGAPWVAGGGERVAFLCTTHGCPTAYRAAAKNVHARGGHAILNIAGTGLHNLNDPVVRSMRRDWGWLVENAPGWERYAPSQDEGPPQGTSETF